MEPQGPVGPSGPIGNVGPAGPGGPTGSMGPQDYRRPDGPPVVHQVLMAHQVLMVLSDYPDHLAINLHIYTGTSTTSQWSLVVQEAITLGTTLPINPASNQYFYLTVASGSNVVGLYQFNNTWQNISTISTYGGDFPLSPVNNEFFVSGTFRRRRSIW